MARVEGEGLKSRASYVAKEAMATGLYWLREVEVERQEPKPDVKVRLSPDVVKLVAKRKRAVETLAVAVEQLLMQVCDSCAG